MDIVVISLIFLVGIAAGAFFRGASLQRRMNELDLHRSVAERLAEERAGSNSALSEENRNLLSELREVRENLVARDTEYKSAEIRIKEGESQIERLKIELKLQFENMAHKIFEDKTSSFREQSQHQLTQLLQPLGEKLMQFQKKVDDSFNVQAIERNSLKEELQRIVLANKEMTLQAESLTKALRGDVKAQGDWGEVVLERILGASGLREGEEYVVQGKDLKLKHVESGGALRPDIVIKLPDDKHVIVDSKVSLESYRLYISEEEDVHKNRELKKFLDSLRAHVVGLASKRYQDVADLRTPDFVLMFIPIEGAYALAMAEDQTLHSFAWEKRIVLVCPTTLFATLRTISSIWRIERQNRNAQEIADRGSKLYEKFVGFAEDLAAVGRQIELTQRSYNEATKKLSEGRGNLVSQIEKLRELGVKSAKNIPTQFLLDEDSSTEDAQSEDTSLIPN